MKKFSRVIALILSVMMLIGMLPTGVFAAEDAAVVETGLKPGPNVIADPESPTGYTVKFLYQNDTAETVTFAGDIGLRDWAADTTRNQGVNTSPFDYKPGMMRCFSYTDAMVKLTEGEYAGWWYYELPLAAGANQYWFYVDGNTNYMVPDPNNMPAWSPRSNVNTKNAYNAVYVPYDEKQDYEPMKAREAENPRTDGKSGTWSYVQLEYTTGAKHWAGVYLPYGYDENREEPYKTIYMLHGFGQDESDWMGIGSVQKIMDNLAAEGRTEPAVIVSVTSDNGMISSGGGFFGGGSYGIVATELIPAIEKLYNVSDKAEDRAWMGLSMGSMNTQNMINANAPLFGYYGAFSGGCSVRATTAGLDQTHIVIGYGSDDRTVALTDAVTDGVQAINDNGGHAAFEYVCGGHDFNAWCQLFRIMCEDYLWNPAAFGDVEDPYADLQPGPNVIADPEAPTGYTVKFLYENETAETVTFAGDIALRNWADLSDTTQYTPWEYQPGMMRSGSYTAPMEKIEEGKYAGWWYYELPLAAGANQYWFYVDGNTRRMMPDPNNAPIWSPNSSATKNAYNAVYVPYDAKQDFEPLAARAAELPRAEGDQKGTWSYVPIVIGEATKYMGVYLPYGFDAEREEPYKTIYAVHGGGQDESDWMGIGSVQNIMDNLVAEGKTEPAIIVTPASSYFGSNFSNVFNVIIPYIEEHYNASAVHADRAFCGLSAGGGQTRNMINSFGNQFDYYGPWSSSNTNDGYAAAQNLENAHIMFGVGEFDPLTARHATPETIAELEAKDAHVVYEVVAGAHDFNSWCQLFRIFLEDYAWNPAAFGDTGAALEDIDFTDPASADRFEVENQASTEIREGQGLYMISTKDVFEPEGTPKDVVKIPVGEDDWTATLQMKVSTGSGWGWGKSGELFGFYAMDDYNNFAGIRAAMNNMQDIVRKDGEITAGTQNKTPGLSSYNNQTIFLRIVKTGDDYACAISTDGGYDYTDLFTLEDTGINGGTICLDAYSTNSVGYNYLLDNMSFAPAKPNCEHDYALDESSVAVTCLTNGTNVYVCSKCGKSYTETVRATGHVRDEGVVTPATCTEAGYTTFICTVCGESFTGDNVAALGHSWDEGVVTKEATETEFGTRLFTCTVCGETKEGKILPTTMKLGPTVVADPESPTGYTVKFVYENADAKTVTFACDCGLKNAADLTDTKQYTPWDYQPGFMRSGSFTAPMEDLGGGLWYYELPLAAGANQYWFYVDGNTNWMRLDPNNAPMWSPNSAANKNAYNAVYVPYDEKQAYEPMAARVAENPRADEKVGTWSYVPIVIGTTTHFMGVYLPYGYDAERAEPYKTIYMLHGMGQDESDWMGIGSVQKIMDNLAAEGRTEAAVIVSVTSNNNFLGSNYVNVPETIIPFIEANYNVSTKAIDRAWAGLSMGSSNTQSMINGGKAGLFGYFGCFSLGNSVSATAADLDKTHILFGDGADDFGKLSAANIAAIDTIKANGGFGAFERVSGAHDFNTWCQLFRIWCENYLWNPAAFGDVAALEDIDFTDPASADRFEVENQASTEIREGEGLYMISTKDVFEPEGTPKDVVKIPVGEDDWTATLQMKVSTGSGWSWGKSGELFAFYAMDDYNNFAGIRAAMNNMQDIVRKDGEITAGTQNKTPGLSSYNNRTIFLRIVKTGDDYACAISTDGGYDYTDLFTLEDTGINGGTICLDAYSTNSVGYNYLLDNMSFAPAKPNCEHDYALDESSVAVTCLTNGTNVFVCSKCGKTYTETVRAPGHTRDEGVITAPTCTEAGYTTFICTVCGETFTGDNVAALGHSWDEGVVTKEATETEFGAKLYTCTVCAETKEVRILPTTMKLGPTVVADPESPTGYTVKFVYENATAKEVTFACDCGLKNDVDLTDNTQYTPWDYQPGMMRSGGFTAPMEELGDGLWYYELPLAGGANQYWYYVDGNTNYMVPDPVNAPYWSPNSAANKNAYNAVYVPYDEKQDYEPMRLRAEAENPKNGSDRLVPPNYADAAQYEMGTWSYVNIPSISENYYVGVYLPYGYDPDRAEPYKTIYICHGGGQDESDWVGIGSVQNIMDNLAAAGKTEPAVIIAPNINAINTNSYAPLVTKIVPFVEENYNVSTDKMDRAMAGLSMGGMATMSVINSDPKDADGNSLEKFGYYGPWSGGNSVKVGFPGQEYSHILFAGGHSDFGNPSESSVTALADQGVFCKYVGVTGAHDFSTWCQMFRIWLTDYIWKPASVGDTLGLDLGPVVVEDPESPTGYTGKFLYFNDEVESVTFCGDLMLSYTDDPGRNAKLYSPFDYKPGMMRRGGTAFQAPMVDLGGGYWYYELPLTAGANQYWFNLPGSSRMQPDPANHPQWSPASNWNTKNAYNAIYVPYADVQDNEVLKAREIENPREGQNNGTWSYVPYTLNDREFYMGVYLPYGYDADRAEPYKTIYVLHGGGQDESDWLGIGSVQNIIDNLYADGRIEDAPILIVPGTGSNRMRTGNLEATFAFVEANYNVSADRMDRAVCGLSMGAMTINSILGDDKNREEPTFGYYGLFSGGQPSNALTSKHLLDSYYYVGNGLYEGSIYNQNLVNSGAPYHFVQYAGAHDFNSWCQLFTDYVDNYAFQPDNFERKLFDDVDADAYYYDAVKWAVDNGITNGFEPGIFAPDNSVTRAQIVTMLWRAAGCPAASAPATFKDVKADQYYAEAVAWAVENGITNGMGKNMFAPNDTCTRGQIVTFLWRYMGKPAAEAAAEFTDVPAGEYYADAVAWAVEAGVTTGFEDGTFRPANDCTRAQAVTFLMRALAD